MFLEHLDVRRQQAPHREERLAVDEVVEALREETLQLVHLVRQGHRVLHRVLLRQTESEKLLKVE